MYKESVNDPVREPCAHISQQLLIEAGTSLTWTVLRRTIRVEECHRNENLDLPLHLEFVMKTTYCHNSPA